MRILKGVTDSAFPSAIVHTASNVLRYCAYLVVFVQQITLDGHIVVPADSTRSVPQSSPSCFLSNL